MQRLFRWTTPVGQACVAKLFTNIPALVMFPHALSAKVYTAWPCSNPLTGLQIAREAGSCRKSPQTSRGHQCKREALTAAPREPCNVLVVCIWRTGCPSACERLV